MTQQNHPVFPMKSLKQFFQMPASNLTSSYHHQQYWSFILFFSNSNQTFLCLLWIYNLSSIRSGVNPKLFYTHPSSMYDPPVDFYTGSFFPHVFHMTFKCYIAIVPCPTRSMTVNKGSKSKCYEISKELKTLNVC